MTRVALPGGGILSDYGASAPSYPDEPVARAAYAVKEIFHTLQGEGVRAGTAAVFVRFAGCNLWSGRDEDRATAACRFCDTDFVGATRYTRAGLVDAVSATWVGDGERWAVITGGEPLLQFDRLLAEQLADAGFRVAVETNGTIAHKVPVDWLTVSPKAGTEWLCRHGQELKLVYPQPGLMPGDIGDLGFAHYCLQPMDGPALAENTRAAVAYCLAHPRWRLSLQTHKTLGIR